MLYIYDDDEEKITTKKKQIMLSYVYLYKIKKDICVFVYDCLDRLYIEEHVCKAISTLTLSFISDFFCILSLFLLFVCFFLFF